MDSDKSSRRIVDASLLRAIVDQFVRRPTHPIGDIRQFEQLALGLIDIVGSASVAQVARPLCFHAETPPSIFARLLGKGGPCAELALEYAPALPRAELQKAALQGAAPLACAVARRADIDRDLTIALAHRGEREVLRALAGNASLHFDPAARRVLTMAARDDATLARMLLDRDDVDLDPEPLFLAATRLERTGIILNACRRTLTAGTLGSRPAPPDFVARFETAAVARDREAMADLMASALECRKERLRAIFADAGGEALALALAALGYDADAATRVFLCANPAISHDTDRVRALVALVRSTPQRAAAQVVAAFAGATPRPEKEPARAGALGEDSYAARGWRRVVAAPPTGDSTRKTV